MIHKSVLEAIGNTPLIKLNEVAKDCQAELYAKCEFLNPGGSIKDRLGMWLIQDAEKRGALKPGGTIIEGTSGNTGVGLAISAAIKGYKCIFVLPDKMSEEKINTLRAYGAKVVVTPTAVEPEDPRSYYSVSKRLTEETPNSFYANQYNNLANRECHFNLTGPEILKQMPDIDIFIAGIGTGGTICGVGRYLKEHKPEVEVVAVDCKGSIVMDVFKHGKPKNPAETYLIEGIGEDFIPENYDFSVISDMVQVEDKESFLETRAILKKEGLYVGVSSGAALVGAKKWLAAQGDRVKGKKVAIIFCDSGNRYLSKVFNDDWMRDVGFIESPTEGVVQDFLNSMPQNIDAIVTVQQNAKVNQVIEQMKAKGISQMPVKDENGFVKGLVTENSLLSALFEGRASQSDVIEGLIDSSIEFVTPDVCLEHVFRHVLDGKTPVVVDDPSKGDMKAIITKIDLISYMGKANG